MIQFLLIPRIRGPADAEGRHPGRRRRSRRAWKDDRHQIGGAPIDLALDFRRQVGACLAIANLAGRACVAGMPVAAPPCHKVPRGCSPAIQSHERERVSEAGGPDLRVPRVGAARARSARHPLRVAHRPSCSPARARCRNGRSRPIPVGRGAVHPDLRRARHLRAVHPAAHRALPSSARSGRSHHVMRCGVAGHLADLPADRVQPDAAGGRIAINFSAPLFATLASALLLKETVGPARWTALLVGFLRRAHRHQSGRRDAPDRGAVRARQCRAVRLGHGRACAR